MYPNFDNMFNGFKEELGEVIKRLQDSNIIPVYSQAEVGLATVFSALLNSIDPLIPKAGNLNMMLIHLAALSQKDVAELPSKIEFGITKDFCPVALRDSKLLIRGAKNIAASYEVI
jgi:hypothetical protein